MLISNLSSKLLTDPEPHSHTYPVSVVTDRPELISLPILSPQKLTDPEPQACTYCVFLVTDTPRSVTTLPRWSRLDRETNTLSTKFPHLLTDSEPQTCTLSVSSDTDRSIALSLCVPCLLSH